MIAEDVGSGYLKLGQITYVIQHIEKRMVHYNIFCIPGIE